MEEQISGLIACCRYAYPPNSLSLCGPVDKKAEMKFYSTIGEADGGTVESLKGFSTLYPYLVMIARENNIKNPFDIRAVEAYWLGNRLLDRIPKRIFAEHLREEIGLKKKLDRKVLARLMDKFRFETMPHHSFHVLNVYKRTGHLDIPQTVRTMDACLINWGKVTGISNGKITIKSQRLKHDGSRLYFEKNTTRTIKNRVPEDLEAKKLRQGDLITYHWGIFCTKINLRQMANLKYYTELSVRLANL